MIQSTQNLNSGVYFGTGNGYMNAFPFEWKLIINANSVLCLVKKSLNAQDSGSENGFGPG